MVKLLKSVEKGRRNEMTVKDLIVKLKELPQDVLVISNFKDVETVYYTDSCYVLNNLEEDYAIEEAVALE